MNRSALIIASVAALLVVSAFSYGTLWLAAQSLAGTVGGAGVGCQVQYAQFRPPALFDRGVRELSCRDRYGGPSIWTNDRTKAEVTSITCDVLTNATSEAGTNWTVPGSNIRRDFPISGRAGTKDTLGRKMPPQVPS